MAASARYLTVFYLTFFPVYFGGDFVSGWVGAPPWHLAFAWEQAIPLVPWMLVPYVSVLAMYLLIPVCLPPEGIRRLSHHSTAVILIAGAIFVLVPTETVYQDQPPAGVLRSAYEFIWRFDAHHNLMPSLHVALGGLICLACHRHLKAPWRVGLWLWFLVMAVSTVLTHRHHAVDVASGIGLAAAVGLLWPVPTLRRASGAAGTSRPGNRSPAPAPAPPPRT